MVEVSVILPIFNAEDFVENSLKVLHEFLRSYYDSFEIIAVDDGSTDTTSIRLSRLRLDRLRVLRIERNHGKGYAVAHGMQAAQGSCRIFTDVDLPYDLRAILFSADLINRRGYQIVVGDRTLVGSDYYGRVSKLRSAASRVFATVIRLGITGEMYDTQCGFKAFQSNTAQELFSLLQSRGFAFDVELLYIALKYNMEIRRIPMRYRASTGTTVHPFIDGPAMLCKR
jgi:dolichyl-phosphate beta-glucosyltransferase